MDTCAIAILRTSGDSAEGHFLLGLVRNAEKKPVLAAEALSRALELDPGRYDAAVELANQYCIARRNAEASALLDQFAPKLSNSPRYLDMAGTVYTHIGLPEKAWPLYKKANELQPGVDLFQANLAACGIYLGKIEVAKAIYKELLARYPAHQRNHYHLSRLERAKDTKHIEQMVKLLGSINLPPEKNVFMYYAIGKEFEDLERWNDAFRYYKMAGDAVAGIARYDLGEELDLIDRIIKVCDAEWLRAQAPFTAADAVSKKIPIFIVGLPRTGTTLTERILSSHSQVESVGETTFIQMVLRRESGVQSMESMTPAMIEALAHKDMGQIAAGYLSAVNYRLGSKPLFIDKLPFNFLYLGFIAKAFPNARIIHLRRNPMDACFAMYKQVFTFAYKFSYMLEGLGEYYVAYERLRNHWCQVLGDRLVEIEYESLVADQEEQTRLLLTRLGLDFEPACLAFEENKAASATASSIQVREKIHARSVNRWTHFSKQLQPLRDRLEAAGIAVAE